MLGNHQIKKEPSDYYNMTSSELFKSNFMENNQGWNQQTPEPFPSPPIYDSFNTNYEDEEEEALATKHNNNSRVHLRHFSANDSHCIRNSSYLASPSSSSSPFLLQQNNSSNNNIPSSTNTEINSVIPEFDKQQQRRLRFDIVLEAATAVTQKAEESAITYLNRGQVYGIQLNDKQGLNEVITSTLSIAFHSSSHRRIAESYWKFWVGQQKQTEARAIDIDASQSTGISDLKFPSFDKITFNWNGRFGSKIFVRFKCLSTDFSRIKGVKGIPLRTQMESHVAENESTGTPAIDEICFCKVKLFRDKGAERKNKDDAKQISKQLEKVYGKANEQSLPLMYNVSLPYSVFGEIPTSSTLDSFEHAADDLAVPLQIKTPARYHTRVMTAPNSIFYQSNRSNGTGRGRKSISSVLPPFSPMVAQQQDHNNSKPYETSPTVVGSSSSNIPLASNFIPTTKENYDFHKYLTQQQHALAALPNIDTNNLRHESNTRSVSLLEGHNDYNTIQSFDDDLPPLTADTTLHTPGTAQATPTEFSHHGAFDKKLFLNSNILTPDLLVVENHLYNQQQQTAPMLSSIYDVFTPEEIQQPPESCSITPTREDFFGLSPHSEFNQQQLPINYHQRDYFCSMEPNISSSSHISLLQQQLQLHNETATNIMLNNNTVSNMLLLSPSPPNISHGGSTTTSTNSFQCKSTGGGRRKKKRGHSELIDHQPIEENFVEETSNSRILTYSTNPSHITLSTASSINSNCSSTSSICSINSDTAANNFSGNYKKPRYHNLSP